MPDGARGSITDSTIPELINPSVNHTARRWYY